MKKSKFPEEFKLEAVKQVVERDYSVSDVAKRLGVSVQSLYKWVKEYSPNAVDRYEAELKEVRRENLKLKAELKRAQEDRDILKKAAVGSIGQRNSYPKILICCGELNETIIYARRERTRF